MSRKTSKSMRLSKILHLNGNICKIDRCDWGRLKYTFHLHMKYLCCNIEWWWGGQGWGGLSREEGIKKAWKERMLKREESV